MYKKAQGVFFIILQIFLVGESQTSGSYPFTEKEKSGFTPTGEFSAVDFHDYDYPLDSKELIVPLRIKDRAGIDRRDEPVTFGIPIAHDQKIYHVNEFYVTDGQQGFCPAQFRVLARYHGPPEDESQPIKVVLMDFQADVDANQQRIYYLNNGKKAQLYGPKLAFLDHSKHSGFNSFSDQPDQILYQQGDDLISENTTHFIISTGAVIAKISKTNFNLFDEVYIDDDNDGLVDDQIIASSATDGAIINYQGVTYSSNNAPHSFTIEDNGALRAVVKVEGYFKNSSNQKLYPPLGDNGISYTCRLTAYKDKSFIKVDFTLENENRGWAYGTSTPSNPVHNIYINSCFIQTTAAGMMSNKTAAFQGFSDNFTTADYKLLQSETSDSTQNGYTWEYIINKNNTAVASGQQYDGFADLRDSDKGVMIASRWFWQNHPKGMEIDNNVLKFHLWPDTGTPHRILGGIWKTHQLMYYFHGSDTDFADELATLKKRLVAGCPDGYYADTDFFMPMVPEHFSTDVVFPAGETLQDALEKHKLTYRAKFNQSYATSSYYAYDFFHMRDERRIMWSSERGTWASWYGWLEFGDTPRGSGWGYSSQHYNWSYIALAGFLQFCDYDMFDFGEELASHKADMIVIHDPYAEKQTDYENWLFHGGQRYEADGLLHLHGNYNAVNNSNAKAASHFWTNGLTLQYLLTGEERFKEAVKESYDHIVRVQDTPSMTDTALRNALRGVEACVNGYELLGDIEYLNSAFHIAADNLIAIREVTNGNESYLAPANPDNPDKVWVLFDSMQNQFFIKLYYSLKSAGKTTEAQFMLDFLIRWKNWVFNSFYGHWFATCGTYQNGFDQYFPYLVKREWVSYDPWVDDSGILNGDYSVQYADLFACIYEETGDENALDIARNIYKDFQFYGTTGGSFLNTRLSWNTIPGFAHNQDNAWLKTGMSLSRPYYYLRTEYKLSLTTHAPGASVKVFLDSPYDRSTHNMSTHLDQAGLLGSNLPANAVDWITLQLRDAVDYSVITEVKVLVLHDGQIVTQGGETRIPFADAADGDYYLAIKHRNHLDIMSATPVTLTSGNTTSYDFTDSADKSWGSATKQLEAGVWGMWSGDIDSDGTVQISDYQSWFNSAKQADCGYHTADLNMDTIVTSEDYVCWYNSYINGAVCSIP